MENFDWDYDTDDSVKRGNPIASNRFRWQTYTIDTDDACESEWAQSKAEATIHGREIIRQFNKFGKDDLVVKIFNEMNYKQKPVIITLEDAYRMIPVATK